jgi:hypothetical protein
MNADSTADNFMDRPEPQPHGRLAPLLIGSVVAVMALWGRAHLGEWLHGFLTARDPLLRASLRDRLSRSPAQLPSLRGQLLGRRKAEVASTFGPPRTAVLTGPGSGAAPMGQSTFWRADTWYYAIDSAGHTAMAIRFDRDVATEVSFFSAPED